MPLALSDNLRLTPITRSCLWPASASGRQQSSCWLASATAIAALQSGRLHWLHQTACGRSDLVGESRQTPIPAVGQLLWRLSAVPRNLTLGCGGAYGRVSGSATTFSKRLLALESSGRCRPRADCVIGKSCRSTLEVAGALPVRVRVDRLVRLHSRRDSVADSKIHLLPV